MTVVVVEIGVALVIDEPVSVEIGVNTEDVHVSLLGLVVVIFPFRTGRIRRQAVITAQRVDLGLGHSRVVGVVEFDAVVTADERDSGIFAYGLEIFNIVGASIHIGIGPIPVGTHVLISHDNRCVIGLRNHTGVGLKVTEEGVVAAIAQRRDEGHIGARILGKKANRAAVSRLTQRAGGTRTAINDNLAEELGRPVAGRVVTGAVQIAERNAVDRNIIFAVLETANGHFRFGKTGTVGADTRHAGRHTNDFVVVSGRRHRIVDIGSAENRLRLQGIQLCLRHGLGERGLTGLDDFDFVETYKLIFIYVGGGGRRFSSVQTQQRHRQCEDVVNR